MHDVVCVITYSKLDGKVVSFLVDLIHLSHFSEGEKGR